MGIICKKRGVILLFSIVFVMLLSNIIFALSIDVDKVIYENGENVYFTVCSNDINITEVDVTCIEDLKLEKTKWSLGCNLYSFRTLDSSCSNPIIIAKDNIQSINKVISINDFGIVLERQLLEKGNITSSTEDVDIAEMIYGYSLLERNNTVKELLDVLKIRRNNLNKCWPESKCDIRETVDILYYLSEAGVNSSYRIYKDALLWLETQQYILDEEVEITIGADENTTCKVFEEFDEVFEDEEEREEIDTYTIGEDEEYVYKFLYTSGQKLNFTCDDDFYVEIIDSYDYILLNDYGDGSSDFSEGLEFEMNLGCWSPTGNNLSSCSVGLTSKIALLNDLNENVLEDAEGWLEAEIREQKMEAKKVKSTTDILVNLMSYAVLEDDLIKNYILYSQNNDGSFGIDDDKPLMTLYAIKYFNKEKSEWVDDAIDWIQTYRQKKGFDQIVENGLMYELFYTQNPIVKIDPIILNSTMEDIKFKIISSENLTDVTYSLQGANIDKIKINGSDTFIEDNVALSIVSDKDGIYNGYFNVKSTNVSYEFPFVFYDEANLDLSLEDKIVYGKTGEIGFNITKSDSIDNCHFDFGNDMIEDKTILVNEDYVNFVYNVSSDSVSELINVEYICTGKYQTIKQSGSFQFTLFPSYPFGYEIIKGKLDKNPAKLRLWKNLNQTVVLNLRWLNLGDFYEVPSTIILDDDKVKVLHICQTLEVETTRNLDDILKIDSMGYSTEIPFEIYLDDVIEDKCGLYDQKSYLWLYIIIGIFLVALLVVLYNKRDKVLGYSKAAFLKMKKDKKSDLDKSESSEDDDKKSPLKKHKKIKHVRSTSLAEILVALDESMGESKEEISKELKSEGYPKKEIKSTFNSLEQIKAQLENLDKKENSEESDEKPDDKKSEEKKEK